LNPLLADDASYDSDGDGLTNLEEFLAGTDPTNGSDLLRMTGVDWVAGTVRLQFRLVPGKVYDVQYRDAAGPDTWQSLQEVGPEPTARSVEVLDANLTGVTGRLYRIVLRRILSGKSSQDATRAEQRLGFRGHSGGVASRGSLRALRSPNHMPGVCGASKIHRCLPLPLGGEGWGEGANWKAHCIFFQPRTL
jgi:hypothetical protein